MYIYIGYYIYMYIKIADLFCSFVLYFVQFPFISHKFYNCQFHKFVSKRRSYEISDST